METTSKMFNKHKARLFKSPPGATYQRATQRLQQLKGRRESLHSWLPARYRHRGNIQQKGVSIKPYNKVYEKLYIARRELQKCFTAPQQQLQPITISCTQQLEMRHRMRLNAVHMHVVPSELKLPT